MKVAAIVPAAGIGRRIKSSIEKPYIQVCGKAILAHTLLKLSEHSLIDEIVVAVHKKKIISARRALIDRFRLRKVRLVVGGKERVDSVFNALKNVSKDIDYILVHDGIRPFITDDIIERSLKAARRFGASVVAVPVKPTLKYVDRDGRVKYTPDRRNFWEAQTPQVFRRDLLEEAFGKLKKEKARITDDSMLVELIGVKPKIVMGSYRNIKVTTPEDLELAKILIDKDRSYDKL